MFKKMIMIVLVLISFNSFAESINICSVANGIKVLYSGQKDFTGITNELLENKRIINKNEKLFLDNYFKINAKNKKLFISSENLKFKECLEISNKCEDYKNLEHYNYSGICTPLVSKINLIVD